MNFVLATIIGYLMGSIPSALILAKRRNIDIRQHGSGNIGGTNAFRVLGKKAGMIVTLSDIVKGMIPTWLGFYLGGDALAILAGISASVGHSYSIFANFKGGKSVATSTGVLIVLNPYAILIGVGVFAFILFLSKYVSLASMSAAVVVMGTIWFIEDSFLIQMVTLFFGTFIIIRHHSNIKRLIQKKENKVVFKKKKI